MEVIQGKNYEWIPAITDLLGSATQQSILISLPQAFTLTRLLGYIHHFAYGDTRLLYGPDQ